MTETRTSSRAAEYFRARLEFETDVSDVATELASPAPSIVLLDSRGYAAWDQGHIPGALHLPTAEIEVRARGEIQSGADVVTYCWGPGCNGATRAALALSELGFEAREMLGGFEYWVREGLEVVTADGVGRRPVDPLTSPSALPVCDC